MKRKKSSFDLNLVQKKYSFKYLYWLYMLITVFMVSIIYNTMEVCGIIVSASVLLSPLTYFLADIVSTAYTYKEARRMIYLGIAAEIAMIFILQLLSIFIKSPDYLTFTYHFTRGAIANMIPLLISEILNARIFIKLRSYFEKERFWFRSLTSTVIANVIYLSLAAFVAFWGVFDFRNIFLLIVMTLFIKAIIAAFLGIFGPYIVSIITLYDRKRYERDYFNS